MWSHSIEFDQATRGSGASQELAFGDNVDGMALFEHDGRNVLGVCAVGRQLRTRKRMDGSESLPG